MNVLVADKAQQREKLEYLLGTFRKAAVDEPSNKVVREKAVNAFLDSILKKKEYLNQTTANLEGYTLKLREFAWFTGLEPEVIDGLRIVLDLVYRLHGLIVKNYVLTSNSFAKSNIGKSELVALKEALDDFKEVAEDLHERFFVIPQDAEFQSLMAELNDLDDAA